jgi:hypothetical protein
MWGIRAVWGYVPLGVMCHLGLCAAWGYVPLGELCRGGPVFCRGFPVDSGSLYKKNVVSLAAAREDDIFAFPELPLAIRPLFCTCGMASAHGLCAWGAVLVIMRDIATECPTISVPHQVPIGAHIPRSMVSPGVSGTRLTNRMFPLVKIGGQAKVLCAPDLVQNVVNEGRRKHPAQAE